MKAFFLGAWNLFRYALAFVILWAVSVILFPVLIMLYVYLRLKEGLPDNVIPIDFKKKAQK